MILNKCGEIAVQCWREIPQHFPNTILHEYVIMPNHLHGIIEITNDSINATVGVESRYRKMNSKKLFHVQFVQLFADSKSALQKHWDIPLGNAIITNI